MGRVGGIEVSRDRKRSEIDRCACALLLEYTRGRYLAIEHTTL